MLERKRDTPEFKLLDSLKNEANVTELASWFGVHTTRMDQWRNTLLYGVPVFTGAAAPRRLCQRSTSLHLRYRSLFSRAQLPARIRSRACRWRVSTRGHGTLAMRIGDIARAFSQYGRIKI